MRTLLLSAGIGTRLKPLTDTKPKCLMPIKDQPLLDIWLERLTAFGLGPFLINTHYLSNQVYSYIDNSLYKKKVTISHEKKLLGTAGTVVENIDFFQDEAGLIIHADNYCLADFTAFVQAHNERPPYCLMTMMTFRTNSPSSSGIVELNDKGVLTGFHEKTSNPPGDLANAAVYIISNEMLRLLTYEYNEAKDFSIDIIPFLLGKIYTYETKDFFIDIGTPEAYEKAMNRNVDNV